MTDVLIIGGGPAGVSAALYTARAGLRTQIIASGQGALAKAHAVENYYGFAEAVSGPDLLGAGLSQAKRLGADILSAEVLGLVREDTLFTAQTTAGTHSASVVILAAGAARTRPGWDGLANFEGRGVSYCAMCDAFFFRGKDVAVAGNGAYALHEAEALLPLVRSVTVCTDGADTAVSFPPEVRVCTQKVAGVEGQQALSLIRFADGSHLEVSGLFIAIGKAGSVDLARKTGLVFHGEAIAADARMRTSVPGLFAAGDCTGGMKQIAKAVYEGAVAGTEAVAFLKKSREIKR